MENAFRKRHKARFWTKDKKLPSRNEMGKKLNLLTQYNEFVRKDGNLLHFNGKEFFLWRQIFAIILPLLEQSWIKKNLTQTSFFETM